MPSFTKMQGLGNDFVVFDRRATPFDPTDDEIRKIADRRMGIGCDQVIFLDAPDMPGAQAMMRIRNADASVAEMCGNAARCLALLLANEVKREEIVIQTIVGHVRCRSSAAGMITVDMGNPGLEWQDIPLGQPADTLELPLHVAALPAPVAVSMGNPHAVFFVPDIQQIDLAQLGPMIEHHPLFPERANVEFAQVLSATSLRMRVWERGSGVTSACGTGACASLVAAVRRGLISPGVSAQVILDGGILEISWDGQGSVMMTGPAQFSFHGTWEAS